MRFYVFSMFQSAQSMQSLHNINLDNYGYSMGGAGTGNTPFQDLLMNQRGNAAANMMHAMHAMGESGLSPPYSNQSPPHSVQSNLALSPQGYIGKFSVAFKLSGYTEVFDLPQVHHRRLKRGPVCQLRRRTSKRCGTPSSKSTGCK